MAKYGKSQQIKANHGKARQITAAHDETNRTGRTEQAGVSELGPWFVS